MSQFKIEPDNNVWVKNKKRRYLLGNVNNELHPSYFWPANFSLARKQFVGQLCSQSSV